MVYHTINIMYAIGQRAYRTPAYGAFSPSGSCLVDSRPRVGMPPPKRGAFNHASAPEKRPLGGLSHE